MKLLLKILTLALVSSLFGWMAFLSFLGGEWVMALIFTLIIILSNFIYFSKKRAAVKFLFPGLIFLVIFTVTPVIYTTYMSGYIYKIGNLVTKEEATTQLIEQVGVVPDENGTLFEMYPGLIGDRQGAVFIDFADQTVWFGIGDEARKLSDAEYRIDDETGLPKPDGFTFLSEQEILDQESDIAKARYQVDDQFFILAQDTTTAGLFTQTLFYDEASDSIREPATGKIFINNGAGNFANRDLPEEMLMPGWREKTWFSNYGEILTNKNLRDPFIRVLIWTVSFSFITVAMMFFVGLILAIALDKRIRFRNFYRGILILPYAMPSFMSILIWAGIFNREYGAINVILGLDVNWLDSAWLARGVLLLVNLWLGFPYFYLIATGALQALPKDLEEAASIDGASGPQIFWRIKLPLILQILSPLLVASFAFNFNNFNLVYLLTGGGPTNVLEGERAGATDILITFAYKVAFSANDQDYGLASTISVVVFLIVGVLSLWSLKRSRVLEEIK